MKKKIVFGLGNNGDNFTNTRHNLGFIILDKLTSILSLLYQKNSNTNNNIRSNKTSFIIRNKEIYFIKLKGFINESGKEIEKEIKKNSIDIKDIIVIQDDVNLELGKIRFRMNGSSGGHNGVKSIINELKTDKFCRIKIGIGKGKVLLQDWVLGKFDDKEKKKIDECDKEIMDIIIKWIEDKF